MTFTVFIILMVVLAIVGFVTLCISIDRLSYNLKIIGTLIIFVALIAILFSNYSIDTAEDDINSAQVYNYSLEQTSYMDESKEILLEEELSAGIILKYINNEGVSTKLTMLQGHDRYDIIYTEKEASRVEIYNVTAKYTAGFLYKENAEKYYKIYVNKNYLNQITSTELK